MKTTRATALSKRIDNLVTAKKLSKTNTLYGWLKSLKTNEVLRPVYSQGSSWKHSVLIDKSKELTDLLTVLGVEFETGNDAPRGGKTGYFVKIKTRILE
jgi:hypothetical protein